MSTNRISLDELSGSAPSRVDLWTAFITEAGIEVMAEVGVFTGRFAARILGACPAIQRYYLLDPWRHLEDWNKPANRTDEVFDAHLAEALRRTEPYADRRVVLRGTTVEVAEEIPDGSLDLAYVDGDHTLRGITIDLIRLFPKVRTGGFLGGDDFCRSIWQHDSRYEPTLVFPYAVHFAEAVGARVHALGHRQFLIEKAEGQQFEFIDHTGSYPDLGLKQQLAAQPPHPQPTSPARARLRTLFGKERT